MIKILMELWGRQFLNDGQVSPPYMGKKQTRNNEQQPQKEEIKITQEQA